MERKLLIESRSIPMRKRRHARKSKIGLHVFVMFLFICFAAIFIISQMPQLKMLGKADEKININTHYTDRGALLKENGKWTASKKIHSKSNLNLKKIGDYKITYAYSFLGLSKSIVRKIKVRDLEKPQLALNGKADLSLQVGEDYTELGASATDNYDKNLDKTIRISNTVDTSKAGEYQVLYTVKDHSGNETRMSRKVTVFQPVGVIYLTFDDGPRSGTTETVLDTLKSEQIKATFFVTGNGPDSLILREKKEGHSIGLHTFTHDYSKVYSSVASYYADLNSVSDRVKNITGEESKLVRFPGGSSNTISNNYCPGIMNFLVKDLPGKGYQYFDWNVSSGDGGTQPSSEAIYNNVVTNLKTGRDNVVLMHDTNQLTVGALKNIIDYGKANHFAFKKVELDTFPAHHF